MWHLNNNEYEELDKAHIFELLNDYCNALIDEYKDEKIDYLKLETFKENIFVNLENIYIKKLYDLMEDAINRKTSIHFYF